MIDCSFPFLNLRVLNRSTAIAGNLITNDSTTLQTAWFHFSHSKELESDDDECKEKLHKQIVCTLDNLMPLIIVKYDYHIMDIQINVFNIIKMY